MTEMNTGFALFIHSFLERTEKGGDALLSFGVESIYSELYIPSSMSPKFEFT